MNSQSYWYKLFFPANQRQFPGKRWLNIFLRSFHLVGIAGIGGGFIFGLEEAQWLPFWYLAILAGGLLALLYIWSDAIWFLQLRGMVIIVKIFLLSMTLVLPNWRAEIFISIIVLSSLIAHAPGNVRSYHIIKINQSD